MLSSYTTDQRKQNEFEIHQINMSRLPSKFYPNQLKTCEIIDISHDHINLIVK